MASADTSVIKIHCLNKTCFIWNAKDARVLREEFRIIGTLTGSLPRAPRQNNQLGLPLQLSLEEVTLLVEKGVAEVVEDIFCEPCQDDIKSFYQSQKQSYEEQAYGAKCRMKVMQKAPLSTSPEQTFLSCHMPLTLYSMKINVELYRKERTEELKRNLPRIIEGKMAKKRKMLEQEGKPVDIDEAQLEKEITEEFENKEVPAIKEDLALVEMPLVALPRESTTCKVIDWSYPQTPKETLRYKVFRDFWEKGFYLTSGSKFGGDFLVYPGDPARYHSFYVAICIDHDQQMSGLDVITMGRLASNVKKTAVMCSIDNDGKIHQTSLQWTGFS